MGSKDVLYQIKGFDKVVVRYFLLHTKCDIKHILTPTQMKILDYIVTHKDEVIFQKDLESILGLRRATVSGVLKTMEKNHLIKRVVSDQDARIKQIVLHKKARKIFQENYEKLSHVERIALTGILESDLKIFCDVLEKMKENLVTSICEESLKKGEDDIKSSN